MAKEHVFAFCGLTRREIDFANYIVDGMLQLEAYEKAYSSKGNRNTLIKKGVLISSKQEVQDYISKLKQKTEDKRVLNRALKRDLMFGFATDEDADIRARIKAVEVDNLMTGDNKPTEVSVTGLDSLLDKVRRSSK